MGFDLDAYLRRIGHTGSRAPTLDTLASLVEHHVTGIPFENLDVVLGKPPKLDVAALGAKLVDARRGGYCFEHATLFAHVLETLGFTVHRHSARVTMIRPRAEAPRTHMFLSVELPAGTFVVDPGFGGLAPRAPLSLAGTPHGDHWLARDDADVTLMVRTSDGIVPAWVSTMERDYPIDAEMANHFTATSPLSSFTTGIMMRAFTPGGRITVRNRVVTEVPSMASRVLADGAELREVCREHFGFDLPALDGLVLPDWQ